MSSKYSFCGDENALWNFAGDKKLDKLKSQSDIIPVLLSYNALAIINPVHFWPLLIKKLRNSVKTLPSKTFNRKRRPRDKDKNISVLLQKYQESQMTQDDRGNSGGRRFENRGGGGRGGTGGR